MEQEKKYKARLKKLLYRRRKQRLSSTLGDITGSGGKSSDISCITSLMSRDL